MELGILDQIPLPEGMQAEQMAAETKALVQTASREGYRRYWFAEHHSTNGMLSAAPELWIARLAAEAEQMAFGSGGILLPQYSPLKTAETFSTLSAMYPGRIELGVGNSPGGTERTRQALADGREAEDRFHEKLEELQHFLHGTMPKHHPYRIVKTTPRQAAAPPLWLLGLSPRSAETAAALDTGLVFGHFISPDQAEETMERYYARAASPRVRVCVFVVCAGTDAEAEQLALTQDAWLQQVRRGSSIVPSPDHAAAILDRAGKEAVQHERRRAVIGSPASVRQQLEALADVYGTTDFLLITNVHDQEARRHSYAHISREIRQ
ncbi:MsnO8 family LLM class oxidoreductase [Alkalicoccus chagannorensis]|uniref:MsnO8 family LLM class oxidoreductase n=1 Tax=Alkalicoccus chagannorensis TaxID=427072 RepID=UPI0003F9E758|nr:MsnO8 family LLM class oxidoreductase [Alkalicoccus chagannorensis]